jgi:hypothetical protein
MLQEFLAALKPDTSRDADFRVLIGGFVGVALAIWLAVWIMWIFPVHTSESAAANRLILSQWDAMVVDKSSDKLFYALTYVLGGISAIIGAVWLPKHLKRIGWVILGLALWIPLLNRLTAFVVGDNPGNMKSGAAILFVTTVACLFLPVYVGISSGQKRFLNTIIPIVLFIILLLSGLFYAN